MVSYSCVQPKAISQSLKTDTRTLTFLSHFADQSTKQRRFFIRVCELMMSLLMNASILYNYTFLLEVLGLALQPFICLLPPPQSFFFGSSSKFRKVAQSFNLLPCGFCVISKTSTTHDIPRWLPRIYIVLSKPTDFRLCKIHAAR